MGRGGVHAGRSDSARRPERILAIWRSVGRARWFRGDPDLDARLLSEHLADHLSAARGELDDWLGAPDPSLALILLLDQIPRNIFRGAPHAFATDPHALTAARRTLERGFDLALDLELRPFAYMPFLHAEDREAQTLSLQLFSAFTAAGGEASYLASARRHAAIVERFGRFPTRNRILGRASTPEELAVLESREGAATP